MKKTIQRQMLPTSDKPITICPVSIKVKYILFNICDLQVCSRALGRQEFPNFEILTSEKRWQTSLQRYASETTTFIENSNRGQYLD